MVPHAGWAPGTRGAGRNRPRRVVYLPAVLAAMVIATALAIATGTIAAGRLPVRGLPERVALTFLLVQAEITLLLLFCGVALQTLDPGVILIGTLVVLIAVVVAARAVAPGPLWVPRPRLDPAAVLRIALRHPGVAVLGLAVILMLGWRAFAAVQLPVLDYDGYSYHLVTVDVWLQGDAIGRVPHRVWSDGYPAGGELLTLWLVLFTRTDALADLTGLLPLPLAGVATAGLARALGARRAPATVVGLVVMATPAAVALSDSTYVDNLAMADVAAAWLFGVRAIGGRTPSRRVFLSLATGLAVGLGAGVKGSLLVPLGILSAALLVSLILLQRQSHWRPTLRAAIAFVVPVASLAGFWYLKNLLAFGNPLFPFTMGPFAGLGTVDELIVQTPEALRGMSRWAQMATSWLADSGLGAYAYDTRVGGFGLAWPVVLVLAAIGLFWLSRRRRPLALLVVVLPVAGTLAVMPMPWWPRLTLFAVVAGAALAAVAVTRLPRVLGRVGGGALIALALLSLGVVSGQANYRFDPGYPVAQPRVVALTRLLLAPQEERTNLGMWSDCSEFDQMPSGARVRTDGFNLLHLVVGQDLDRVLLLPQDPALPLTPVDPSGARATHLALVQSATIQAARSAPDRYVALGPVCRRVELFAVREP